MNQPFDENRPFPCDPTAHGCTEFDYEEVFERLDGQAGPEACPKALLALSRIIDALMPRRRALDVRDIRAAGLRVIALGWVLNPGRIVGSPSLTELARRCGVTKNHMTSLTAAMSRLADWRNRAQQHAWNWQESSSPSKPRKGRNRR